MSRKLHTESSLIRAFTPQQIERKLASTASRAQYTPQGTSPSLPHVSSEPLWLPKPSIDLPPLQLSTQRSKLNTTPSWPSPTELLLSMQTSSASRLSTLNCGGKRRGACGIRSTSWIEGAAVTLGWKGYTGNKCVVQLLVLMYIVYGLSSGLVSSIFSSSVVRSRCNATRP